jgi:hypothetical protein
MRGVYRFFAGLIAFEVLVQAAAIAYAVFGLGVWVDSHHGVLDKAALDNDSLSFTGAGGFALHGLNGMMIIPNIALLFLIVSFFAKVPGGVKWAALTFLFVIIQVALGLFAHSVPALGILHGPNAIVVFGLAVTANMKARHVEAPAAGYGTTAPDTTTTTSTTV